MFSPSTLTQSVVGRVNLRARHHRGEPVSHLRAGACGGIYFAGAIGFITVEPSSLARPTFFTSVARRCPDAACSTCSPSLALAPLQTTSASASTAANQTSDFLERTLVNGLRRLQRCFSLSSSPPDGPWVITPQVRAKARHPLGRQANGAEQQCRPLRELTQHMHTAPFQNKVLALRLSGAIAVKTTFQHWERVQFSRLFPRPEAFQHQAKYAVRRENPQTARIGNHRHD